MIAARFEGNVHAVEPFGIRAHLWGVAIESRVRIVRRDGGSIAAGVTALDAHSVLLAPFEGCEGIAAGDRVESDALSGALPLGTPLLGRAIDAHGAPVDGGPAPRGRSIVAAIDPPNLAERAPVTSPFWTRIRAIDGLLTIGRGARVGVFGSPGVGKSTLLERIVTHAACDAVVLGLVGERGRESSEWIARCDGRTTIVTAPADRPAAARVQAAFTAVAQAVRLRSLGLDVLLILDSVARFGQALRELAVGAGEPVGRGGYPPSVFARLARILEAGGAAKRGSITLLAAVLIDGDERDPLCEAAQSLLDGHLMLSRGIADAGHFPALDVPRSISRTMSAVAAPEHREAAAGVRAALARLEESREARELGLLPENAATRRAAELEEPLGDFLQQGSEPSEPELTLRRVAYLADTLKTGPLARE